MSIIIKIQKRLMVKLTQKILKELIYYDPNTGVFTWMERDAKWFNCDDNHQCKSWNTKYSGCEAGKVSKEGRTRYRYITITINGIQNRYKSHRLAWMYVYGELPINDIGHIDQDGLNNSIKNLEDITHQINHKNERMSKNNTSGFTGVYLNKKTNKWFASIKVDGKNIHGGTFLDIKDAIEKRKQMNVEYGFHKNHGRK